jgi:hypothetical protein
MMLLQPFGGGLLESAAQAAVIASTLVLVLMLVALGGFAYKQLRGGGVEWPEEDPGNDDTGRSGDAEEWDYY